MTVEPPTRQRLDKWLWFARVVKTRTLAGKLVLDGQVRVNGVRIETPAKAVVLGDILTIALEQDIRVFKVIAHGMRRGPYPEARQLYEDLSPETAPTRPAAQQRDGGSGRPSKRDRRQIDELQRRED